MARRSTTTTRWPRAAATSRRTGRCCCRTWKASDRSTRPRGREAMSAVRVLGRPVALTFSAATVAAALLSFIAGDIHIALVQEHFREWWAYGAFFVAAAAGQGLFAALVLLRQ